MWIGPRSAGRETPLAASARACSEVVRGITRPDHAWYSFQDVAGNASASQATASPGTKVTASG
jgi:hypothetical protein